MSQKASQDVHHPQPHVGPSYSYHPNPNPNPNPTLGLDNSTPSADPGAFLLPATDPYSVHGGGYEGFLAGSYAYVEAAAQAAEAAAQAAEAATGAAEGVGLTSYYYGAGGGEAHLSCGAASVFVFILFMSN